MRKASRSLPPTILLLAALYAAPLAADWLVTRDGGRIETKGKWKIEGAKVVFTLPNGTIGMMRKSEVDLDASSVASAETPKAPAAEAKKATEAKRAPVLTLTDKDIPRATPAADAPADGPAPPPPSTPGAKRVEATQVVVQYWRQSQAPTGGTEISGLIKNAGTSIAIGVSVEIEAKDPTGKVHKAIGFLEKTSLLQYRETTFSAILPELFQLAGEPTIKVTAEGASVGVGKEEPKPAGPPAGEPPGN
jgi:hypothetical protein